MAASLTTQDFLCQDFPLDSPVGTGLAGQSPRICPGRARNGHSTGDALRVRREFNPSDTMGTGHVRLQ